MKINKTKLKLKIAKFIIDKDLRKFTNKTVKTIKPYLSEQGKEDLDEFVIGLKKKKKSLDKTVKYYTDEIVDMINCYEEVYSRVSKDIFDLMKKVNDRKNKFDIAKLEEAFEDKYIDLFAKIKSVIKNIDGKLISPSNGDNYDSSTMKVVGEVIDDENPNKVYLGLTKGLIVGDRVVIPALVMITVATAK